jgi:hypothetical protein
MAWRKSWAWSQIASSSTSAVSSLGLVTVDSRHQALPGSAPTLTTTSTEIPLVRAVARAAAVNRSALTAILPDVVIPERIDLGVPRIESFVFDRRLVADADLVDCCRQPEESGV